MKALVLSTLSLLLLAGCVHVFSDQANSLVDQSISFKQIKQDPKAFLDRYVKFGGIIASTKNTKEGSQVEVVQFSLGSDDTPYEQHASGGRFLAITPLFLDNMVFRTGRPVAVIGQVKGEKVLPLGEISYTYPVIAITEIHVWKMSGVYPYPAYCGAPYYFGPGPPWYPNGWYGPPHAYW
jgi:outer membrane lipoprotein